MTMLSKDDPNDGTDLCMKCQKREPYRNLSVLANELRLYLCHECQQALTALVRWWLKGGS